jgi:hypothetical protein
LEATQHPGGGFNRRYQRRRRSGPQTIPDYALDMHTMKGKAMGRGLDHFRKEGAKADTAADRTRLVHRGSLPALDDQNSRASKIATPSLFRSFRSLCFDCSRHLIREY